jgi:hypothetical protein
MRVLPSSMIRPLRCCAKCLRFIHRARMLPHSITERLPSLVSGCMVGAAHFNQLEVPDQVNAMIEAFLRHYI